MAEEKEMVNPLIKPVGKLKTPTATRQIVGEEGTAEGLKATVMSVVPTDNLSYPSVAVKNGASVLEGNRKEDDLEGERMEVDLEVNKENEEDLEENKKEEDLEVNQKMNDLEEKIQDVNLEDGRYMSSLKALKQAKMMNHFLLNKTHWFEKYVEHLKKEREISYVPQPQMTSSPTSSHILEVKKGEYVKVLMGKTPVVFNRTPVVCYRLNDDLARKIMASPGQSVDTRFKEEYNKLNIKYIGRPVVEEVTPKPVPQPEKKKPLEVTKPKVVKARKEKSPQVEVEPPKKPGLSLQEFVVSDNSDPEDDFDEDDEGGKKTKKKAGGKSKKSPGEPQQPKKRAPRHSKQVAKLVGEIAKSGNPLAKRPPGIGKLDPEVAARAVEKVKQAKAERELKDKMALEERRKKKEEDKQKKEDKKKTILLTDLVSPKALKAEQRKLKKAEKKKEEGTKKPRRVTKPRQPKKKKEEVPLSMPVLVDAPPPKPKESSAVSEVPPQRFAKRTNFKKPSLSDISSSSLSFSSSSSSESSDEEVQKPAEASNPNVTTTAPSQKSPETLTATIPDPVPEEVTNGSVEKPKSPSPPPVNSAVEENPQDALENGQDEEEDLLEIFADIDDDLMPTDIEPSTSSGVRYRKLYD